MKVISAAALFISCWLSEPLQVQRQPVEREHLRATTAAVDKLAKKLGIEFSIPFPKNLDIDEWLKQPIGIIAVGTAKVGCTRAYVNPSDGGVCWILGSPSPEVYNRENVTCILHFDEQGDPIQIGFLSFAQPPALNSPG
jgi:hypothetical protein